MHLGLWKDLLFPGLKQRYLYFSVIPLLSLSSAFMSSLRNVESVLHFDFREHMGSSKISWRRISMLKTINLEPYPIKKLVTSIKLGIFFFFLSYTPELSTLSSSQSFSGFSYVLFTFKYRFQCVVRKISHPFVQGNQSSQKILYKLTEVLL